MSNSISDVLIVDDEPQILRVMRTSLPPRGFSIRTAETGEAALAEVNQRMPSLIILDLVLPDISGLEVCRILRLNSPVPIIALSAKGQESDKVAALGLGADDYVTKPFGMDELLARMRAILRRVQVTNTKEESFKVGDVTMDTAKREVKVSDREVKLTPKEFDLLRELIANAGKVLTRKTLLQAVWGHNAVEQNGYLRVFINILRRKIEPDPLHPKYILTEPWVGYKFATNP